MALASVTDATFDQEVLQSDTPVVVDFWAAWCPPCRALNPVLEQLAEEYGDRIRIVKIDADENQESAIAYRALALPTLKVFRGGEVVKTLHGARPKHVLRAELAQYL